MHSQITTDVYFACELFILISSLLCILMSLFNSITKTQYDELQFYSLFKLSISYIMPYTVWQLISWNILPIVRINALENILVFILLFNLFNWKSKFTPSENVQKKHNFPNGAESFLTLTSVLTMQIHNVIIVSLRFCEYRWKSTKDSFINLIFTRNRI